MSSQEYESAAEEPSLSGFLQEISLYSDQDALADGEDSGGQVTLMTLHNAKGLEFRAVFMLGMEEGIFPHSRSIEENSLEEERRLCYVGHDAREGAADDAARDAPLALRPHRREPPSRFLDELPATGVERERLRPTSWSSYGTPARSRAPPRTDVPELVHRRQRSPLDDRHRNRDAGSSLAGSSRCASRTVSSAV